MRSIIAVSMMFFALVAYADDFTLHPPKSTDGLGALKLWATQYYDHSANAASGSDAIALRDKNGNELGFSLERKDWCNAAMEGTVIISKGDVIRAFNAGELGPTDQTDCSDIFPHVSDATKANIRRQSFFALSEDDRFGLGGTDKYRLVPLRSIAVDRKLIPWGTALFIPGLKGREIILADGTKGKHDGYVFAVDKGNEIKRNHIDFFTGISHFNPAPNVVTSNSKRTFAAFIVKDDDVVAALRKLHVRYGE